MKKRKVRLGWPAGLVGGHHNEEKTMYTKCNVGGGGDQRCVMRSTAGFNSMSALYL